MLKVFLTFEKTADSWHSKCYEVCESRSKAYFLIKEKLSNSWHLTYFSEEDVS